MFTRTKRKWSLYEKWILDYLDFNDSRPPIVDDDTMRLLARIDNHGFIGIDDEPDERLYSGLGLDAEGYIDEVKKLRVDARNRFVESDGTDVGFRRAIRQPRPPKSFVGRLPKRRSYKELLRQLDAKPKAELSHDGLAFFLKIVQFYGTSAECALAFDITIETALALWRIAKRPVTRRAWTCHMDEAMEKKLNLIIRRA